MNEQTTVSETVCSERMKRIEERVDKVEVIQEEIHKLSLSVERLAMTVKTMAETQKDHDSRLDSIEGKDARMWQDLIKTAITGIVGVIIGYALKQIGIF